MHSMSPQGYQREDSEKKEHDPREKWDRVTDENDIERIISAQRYGRVRRVNLGQQNTVRERNGQV